MTECIIQKKKKQQRTQQNAYPNSDRKKLRTEGSKQTQDQTNAITPNVINSQTNGQANA